MSGPCVSVLEGLPGELSPGPWNFRTRRSFRSYAAKPREIAISAGRNSLVDSVPRFALLCWCFMSIAVGIEHSGTTCTCLTQSNTLMVRGGQAEQDPAPAASSGPALGRGGPPASPWPVLRAGTARARSDGGEPHWAPLRGHARVPEPASTAPSTIRDGLRARVRQ